MSEGFVGIPHSFYGWLLLESKNMTKRELIVFLVIVRNTIGYQRDVCKLSCRFVSNATSITPGNVHSALAGLEEKGYVKLSKEKGTTVVELSRSQFGNTSDLGCSQFGNGGVPSSGTEVFPVRERNCSQFGNKDIKKKDYTKTIERDDPGEDNNIEPNKESIFF